MTAASTAIAAPAAQHHAAPAVPAQQVQQIPLAQLAPSPVNPRTTMDEAFLAQLADSIQQLGVQVPLLVRLSSAEAQKKGLQPRLYEIVAGHRRFAAAQKLKLESLPCIVREMSDDEAREIMLVENLQREDLPPLEEADAYETLRQSLGSVQAVAARVGKPIEYVTRRLKLLTLIPFSREALAEKLITIDHALLLAKLAPAEQETALRFTLEKLAAKSRKTQDMLTDAKKRATRDRGWGNYWEPQSVLKLKRFIEDEIKLDLKRAPWDLADASLVADAGACAGCPKNTAANSALFGDLTIKDARCTDAACFAVKRMAFVARQLEALNAAGKDAVRISWKSTTSKPRGLSSGNDPGDAKYLAQVFKAGQWIEAKKGSCTFVRTGVAVDFDEWQYGTPDPKKKPGVQVLVCVSATCKAHKKTWDAPARERVDGQAMNRNSPEARAKREKQAELNKAENSIRAAAVKAALDGVSKLGGELLRRVVQAAFPDWTGTDVESIFPGLESVLEKEKVDSPRFARAAAAALLCNDERYFAHPDGYDTEKEGREALIKLLAVMGYDARKHWQAKREKSSPKAPVKQPTASPARKAQPKAKPKSKAAATKGGKR